MHEFFINFIKTNFIDIVIGLIFIVGLIFLYKSGKKALVKNIILSLVTQAEKKLGNGTGELKYVYVVEKAYNILPISIRWLITKKELDDIIEEAVTYLKIYLQDENKNLLGYDKNMTMEYEPEFNINIK